jgi:dihydrofolate reductase
MIISIIAAMSENHVIGRSGDLPWHLPDDFARFKKITTGHPIIMGRKTFASIGARPLPHRLNIIVTRNSDYHCAGVAVATSLDAALALARNDSDEEVFICGGEQIYRLTIPMADRLYLTVVHTEIEGDTHFPPIEGDQWLLVNQQHHEADARHVYAMTFRDYVRRQ